MVEIFLDTEFSDFKSLRLVSIGLVTNIDKNFYMENSDINSEDCSLFVQKEIFPLLKGGTASNSYQEIRNELNIWLNSFDEDIVFISDYDGDFVILKKLLGSNVEKYKYTLLDEILFDDLVAEHKNKIFYEIYQKLHVELQVRISNYFKQNKIKPHNAFEDAKANMNAILQIRKKIKTNKY